MWNRVVAAASSELGLDVAEMPHTLTTLMGDRRFVVDAVRILPPASALVNAMICRTAWKSHVCIRTAQLPSLAVLRP
jgi:hypothetical protein